MSALNSYLNLMATFDHRNLVAIDRAHNAFLTGALMARKPHNVLELGVGSGYVTWSIHFVLQHNERGTLTTVDNWFDLKGNEPEAAAHMRRVGINVVTMGEREFVCAAATDAYDFLVADADHFHSHEWLDEHLRIVQDGGFLFFHDTNQPAMFPGLATIEGRLKEKGIFCYQFKESSRPDERCDRGFLFAVNSKRKS